MTIKSYTHYLLKILLGFMLMTSFVIGNSSSAQNNLYEIIIDHDFSTPQYVSWSADSTRFVFSSTIGIETTLQDDFEGVTFSRDAWWQYNIDTGGLVSQNVWPLQPLLTSTQIIEWKPNDFIYTSPDNSLGFLNQDIDNFFSVVNFQTGEIVKTNVEGYLENYSPDVFSIYWNNLGDILAFQDVSLGGTGFLYYLTIPNELSNIQTLKFGATPNTSNFALFSKEGDQLYDVSPSGNFVLLSGRNISSLIPVYQIPPMLIIWDPINDEMRTVILPETFLTFDVLDATFSSIDESKLLIVHRKWGLIQVDILTQEIQLINKDIGNAGAAFFSSNSHWLAVFEGSKLKFINIAQLVPISLTRIPLILVESDNITSVSEGGNTDTYTLTLGTQPTIDVTINMPASEQTTVNPSNLTFTSENWNEPQTVTVTAIDDSIAEDSHNDGITHSISSSDEVYNGFSIARVMINIIDNDTSGVTIVESDGVTAIIEGGATDTYTLALGTQPTADVTVNITGDAQVSVSPAALTFTPQNWDVPQTVTVSAVDDSVDESDHTAVIMHSAVSSDAGYNGISVADVTVSIGDDD